MKVFSQPQVSMPKLQPVCVRREHYDVHVTVAGKNCALTHPTLGATTKKAWAWVDDVITSPQSVCKGKFRAIKYNSWIGLDLDWIRDDFSLEVGFKQEFNWLCGDLGPDAGAANQEIKSWLWISEKKT